ncbi:MAG TPA: ABC transporter ATP-binding protein [Candidatus Obscuribacterales bacterium]
MNSAPSIQASKLTKVFGKRAVVDAVDLTVHTGELYALLGDNGAGKTTTINMLTTLLKPTSGRFSIGGFDGISQSEQAKAAFAVVSQEVSLYQELTAYENLLFISRLYGIKRREADQRIDQLLRQWDLYNRKDDRVVEYSGGMQRKMSIAMALLRRPKVLFMDEPTVGLDPSSRHHIWEILKELRNEGVTIFLTTHYLEEAELLADRVGIIVTGKLVIEGTIDELRDKLRGMRTISVKLSGKVEQSTIASRVAQLEERFRSGVKYDALRQSITFIPPQDRPFSETLRALTGWLEEEQLSYSGLATSEPSLEELFLSVAHHGGEAPPSMEGKS